MLNPQTSRKRRRLNCLLTLAAYPCRVACAHRFRRDFSYLDGGAPLSSEHPQEVRMHTYPIFSSPILLVTTVAIAHAQFRPAGLLRNPHFDALGDARITGAAPTQQDQGSVAGPILAGVGLGAVGFVAGAFIGFGSAGCHSGTSDELCGLGEAIIGGAAGGTLGLALGVHLGNGKRGNFALDLLIATATAAGGVALVAKSGVIRQESEMGTIAVAAIPLVELASTVVVERTVGRSRARSRRLTLSVLPQAGGGVALGGSVAWR